MIPNLRTPEMIAVFNRIAAGPPPTTRELAEIVDFDTAELASKLSRFRLRGWLTRDLIKRSDGLAGRPDIAVWSLVDA